MKISKRLSFKISQIRIPHKSFGFCVSVREAGETGIEKLEMASPFPTCPALREKRKSTHLEEKKSMCESLALKAT